MVALIMTVAHVDLKNTGLVHKGIVHSLCAFSAQKWKLQKEAIALCYFKSQKRFSASAAGSFLRKGQT